MQGVNVFTGEKDLDGQRLPMASINTDTGCHWVVARPIGYISLWHKLKCMWLVFREKADIVVWKYQ